MTPMREEWCKFCPDTCSIHIAISCGFPIHSSVGAVSFIRAFFKVNVKPQKLMDVEAAFGGFSAQQVARQVKRVEIFAC